ncbi:hypothetical protein Tco_1553364, partial [Tanacetum coccineum]
YQAKSTKKHLKSIKRVFRYLKGTIHTGLWYPKDNAMALTAYANANHAGCQDTRRSTPGSAQFLGEKLVRWSSKKQRSTAISTTEVKGLKTKKKRVFTVSSQSRVPNTQSKDEVVKSPRADQWKEREKTSPKVPSNLIGPACGPFKWAGPAHL